MTRIPRAVYIAVGFLIFLETTYYFSDYDTEKIGQQLNYYLAPSTEFALPPDYTIFKAGRDPFCKEFWSEHYLKDISRTHQEYCREDGSKSNLECFRHNPDKDHPDKFCVARGVNFHPHRDIQFDLHCQERDWKAESEIDESLYDWPPLSEIPGYWGGTGAHEELKRWNLATNISGKGDKCNRKDNDKRFTMLVKREESDNIWHTMMEAWSAMHTLDILQMTPDPSNPKRTFITPEEIGNMRIIFRDDGPPGPAMDFWTAINGKVPLRLSQLREPECLGTVIMPIPGAGNPYWLMNGEPMDCPSSLLIEAFSQKILRHMGLRPKLRTIEPIRVTIINRTHNRVIMNLQKYVEKLQAKYPEVEFRTPDFAKISFKEQLHMVQDSDVLVGVHGAGMTHVLFLTEEAAVAEIYPTDTQFMLFRNLIKQRGFPFTSYVSMSEEIWNEKFSGESHESHESHEKRWAWQENNIYITEDDFVHLVENALQTQQHRGNLRNHFKALPPS